MGATQQLSGTQPTELPREEVLKASPPMFGTPWLDRFTRVHVAVIPVIFVPVIVAFSILGLREIPFWQGILWAIGGYAVWTLTEYWLHRVVFHFEPDHPVGARIHWMIHGVHHDHPNDPMRLVMPPSASIPLGLLFIGAFQLLLPFAPACMLSAGFFIGYLAYDMTHYYLHHRRPTTRVGRKLRELHMRHHFQDHDRGYGVSAPYWDKVFGTAPVSRKDR
ncbi:MAG: fatty acid hydroxylase [Actinobacteria bacterium]|uniref:Unannotated protein n=1 Tax=freshwater metagenome TaxID=449393 RepID=A0A6J5ZVS1_9ZZZZ|nr:fatty acid hydroxylase [Actinomycetota bacterium]